METSVYKVTEIVGTSRDSWEDAVRNAVETASKTLRNLRIAEVSELDVAVDGGTVRAYRARVKLSFKYEEEEGEDEGDGAAMMSDEREESEEPERPAASRRRGAAGRAGGRKKTTQRKTARKTARGR